MAKRSLYCFTTQRASKREGPRKTASIGVVFLGFVFLLAGQAAAEVTRDEATMKGDRGLYLGAEVGWSRVEIPGKTLTMQGIEFSDINARDNKAGARIFLGYWINRFVGLELDYTYLGNVNATFDYYDPRYGDHGSGETTVTLSASSGLLKFGYDVARDVRLYAKGGIQRWNTSYDSRFDVSGGTPLYRTMKKSGTSLIYGAGASWNFTSFWSLKAEAEFRKMDIADAMMISLGLEFDLSHLKKLLREYGGHYESDHP